MTAPPRPTFVRHGRSDLALHQLRGGDGLPLLHLHGLGEQTPGTVPGHLASWPGPVFGLDFTGHGASTLPRGGGYTAEILVGDVDAAIGATGPAAIFGRGLGAYIGLLAAGALVEHVRGTVLFDGPGLVGGGVRPASVSIPAVPRAASAGPPDPLALVELSRDVRPPDYAVGFVRQAVEWSGIDTPIAVCAVTRPEWLEAVAAEPGVVVASLAEALAMMASPRQHAPGGGPDSNPFGRAASI